MSRARFEVTRVLQVITDESAARGDYARMEEGEPESVDLRGAVEALVSDTWDNVDMDGAGTIIAYPADYSQSMSTGDYSAETVIVHADTLANGERLYACWEGARRAERARVDAYLARSREARP